MAEGPKISVVMAVYNPDEADLRAGIESILNQSFRDFEFVIVDDGSVNGCGDVLKEYEKKDDRIRVIHQGNKGLTKALNAGIKEAKGVYIARQDADDVSYPKRFEMQLGLFENPEVVLVGGNCDDVYPDGHKDVWGHHDDEKLQRIVYLKTPFAHSTAMMRADMCRELGGYDERYRTSQDMELWMRFAKKGRLAMTEDTVMLRKIAAGSISRKRRWRQFYDALRARWKHNRGAMKLCALYCGLRSLAIGLLPYGLLRALKKVKA